VKSAGIVESIRKVCGILIKKDTAMPLTDEVIQSLKPADKPVRQFDGGGLYIEISPSGSRLWRLKYRFLRKCKLLAFGKYPDVSIAAARTKRYDAKSLLAAGIDPGAIHKQEKTEGLAQAARQLAATRFMLDNEGGLYFHFGKRSVSLTAVETQELLAFLDDTRNVIAKDTRNVTN
jgi:hypothetical protein